MTKFTLSVGSWTKIASAGSTIEVQGQYVFLTQSATVPTSFTDAETLYGSDDYRKYDAPLPLDLYASFSYSGPSSSTLTGSVEVLPIGAAGGGGTVQDTAADTALGTPADQPPAGPTTSGSVIAKLGGIWAALLGTLKVQVQNTNVAVTGTFYQPTQPVSALDGGLVTLGTTGDAATASTLIGLTKAVLAKLGAPLAVTGTFYQTTQPVSGTVTANLGTLNGAAQDGTDITGAAMPAGGVGIRGWLSAIYAKLGGVVLAAGTAIIGKVSIDQTTPGTTNGVALVGPNVTAAGTSAANAQAMQGVTNGVPLVTRAYEPTYTLLSNASATGAQVTGIYGASYLFSAVATFGTGGTLTLQVLGPDGVTWLTVVSLTANGSLGVVLGSNATARVSVTGSVSGAYATLS